MGKMLADRLAEVLAVRLANELAIRLAGRLAEVLAKGWFGPLAMRGWLKSIRWLASLAIWLSRRMAGELAACGLLILACLQSL
jgi:hypothetical protein